MGIYNIYRENGNLEFIVLSKGTSEFWLIVYIEIYMYIYKCSSCLEWQMTFSTLYYHGGFRQLLEIMDMLEHSTNENYC